MLVHRFKTNAQSLRRATAVANAQNMPAAIYAASTFDDAQRLRRATTVVHAQNEPVAISVALSSSIPRDCVVQLGQKYIENFPERSERDMVHRL